MHSAHTDESTNFKGKNVAVIGIGSSGIQIVSTLSSQVQQLYTWVRSPTWITAGFAQRFAGIDGGNYECKHGSSHPTHKFHATEALTSTVRYGNGKENFQGESREAAEVYQDDRIRAQPALQVHIERNSRSEAS
jgi:hypothetical protein